MRTPRNIFALRVHHLRTNNVNVYVSKIYPSGLTLEGAYIGGGGYIQDVTCVTYLGGVLTKFYDISRGACLWKVSDHWWYPPTLNLHSVKSGIIIIIIITLFIVDDFQMYKLKCENYNNLQYIYTYIKIHKS